MTIETWRYSEPNDDNYEGWYVAFLDSIGCLAVLSDYGDYGYRWSAPSGTGCEFREFLLKCDTSYILGKIAPKREFDPKETARAVKHHIVYLRRHAEITKDEAREEWDNFGSADPQNDVEFAAWMYDSDLKEMWEQVRMRTTPQAVAFMERVWPRLMAAVKADLEKAEAAPRKGTAS